MSNEPKILMPVDQRNKVIQRAMGLPLVADDFYLGDSSNYAVIWDLSATKYQTRVFAGIAVANPSASVRVNIAVAETLSATPRKIMTVPSQQFITLDNLTYGPGIIDDTEGINCLYLLAKVDGTVGTPSSATIDYSGSGQPSDQDTVSIDNYVFEFSSDVSKDPDHDFIVSIGATADDSWTNLINEINSQLKNVRASIDTVSDVVTIGSVLRDSRGDNIPIADGGGSGGMTGATFSAATLGADTAATGGILITGHIW